MNSILKRWAKPDNEISVEQKIIDRQIAEMERVIRQHARKVLALDAQIHMLGLQIADLKDFQSTIREKIMLLKANTPENQFQRLKEAGGPDYKSLGERLKRRQESRKK